MQFIADLHLHSKYSRATSKKLDLFEISGWASKKGIDIIATGDWTHPLWFRELTTHLKETPGGLYTLKKKPPDQENDVYFTLSTEISSIYSQGGSVRRVHNCLLSPSLKTCQKIIDELTRRGAKLMSDGRPIVGLSSKELLEIVLEIDDKTLFVPAHIWTPWFSLFGSRSGFDSIRECFGDLEKYIYAIETGLSSDPIMNWQIRELETRSILSSSDAHSGPKLGREAVVFIANDKSLKLKDVSFNDLSDAIKKKVSGKLKIGFTIEFFPEEGKYHWSGHRNCNVSMSPDDVEKNGLFCPVCNKPLTIGVENRVAKLSSLKIRENDLLFVKNKNGLVFVRDKEEKRVPFVSLVPLLEVFKSAEGSPTKALRRYIESLTMLGTEFDILMNIPYDDIERVVGHRNRKAVERVRERKVQVVPGYDGVFGTVSVFGNNDEKKPKEKQQRLF